MHEIFAEARSVYNTDEEKAFVHKAYQRCINISIDYGIMEKAQTYMCCHLNLAGAIWVPGHLFISWPIKIM
jgi:mannose-1-phosphate guanylyltransferase